MLCKRFSAKRRAANTSSHVINLLGIQKLLSENPMTGISSNVLTQVKRGDVWSVARSQYFTSPLTAGKRTLYKIFNHFSSESVDEACSRSASRVIIK